MTMKRVPEHLQLAGFVYSNYDHEIDENTAALIDSGEYASRHAAWNFMGVIWKESDRYFEEIRQYGSTVNTIEGSSIRECVERTNEKYGAR